MGRTIKHLLLILLAAASVFTAIMMAHAANIGGVARVIDGDTLSIGPIVIRLHGIDAPEAGQQSRRDARSRATSTAPAIRFITRLGRPGMNGRQSTRGRASAGPAMRPRRRRRVGAPRVCARGDTRNWNAIKPACFTDGIKTIIIGVIRKLSKLDQDRFPNLIRATRWKITPASKRNFRNELRNQNRIN